MAQFTVYRNKNPRSKGTFPFLVDVQSNLLEDLQTRVVIPLSRATALTKKPIERLMPILKLDEEPYVLMTPQLAGIASNDLGAASGSLAEHCGLILGAMDFLVTGF
ncbi:MAG TPA: CcdB family protein [Steroidobacteraceae bacterium]|nr:CcdB family protein [Steroidobacteraceae bacterium]